MIRLKKFTVWTNSCVRGNFLRFTVLSKSSTVFGAILVPLTFSKVFTSISSSSPPFFFGSQTLGATWPAATRVLSQSKRENLGNEVTNRSPPVSPVYTPFLTCLFMFRELLWLRRHLDSAVYTKTTAAKTKASWTSPTQGKKKSNSRFLLFSVVLVYFFCSVEQSSSHISSPQFRVLFFLCSSFNFIISEKLNSRRVD